MLPLRLRRTQLGVQRRHVRSQHVVRTRRRQLLRLQQRGASRHRCDADGLRRLLRCCLRLPARQQPFRSQLWVRAAQHSHTQAHLAAHGGRWRGGRRPAVLLLLLL